MLVPSLVLCSFLLGLHRTDSCESCPENGRCVDGSLECIQGFRKRGSRCVEDGLLTQTANRIAESLQRRICDEHARFLCGQPGKILFQRLDISNMADELLSNDPARLTDGGIQLVKDRVLQSANGFFETTSTDNGAQAFKCPDVVAELHRPLDCQVRQWISRNVVFVTAFGILHCSGFYGAFTRDGHCQIEPSRYMSRMLQEYLGWKESIREQLNQLSYELLVVHSFGHRLELPLYLI